MKVSRVLVAVCATSLCICLAGAPSAMAASGKSGKAKSAAAITTKSLNSKLKSQAKTLASTRKTLRTVNAGLTALGVRLKNSEGGLATILGAAPQLVSGLTALSNAVQNQIAPGLKTLGDAVTGQIVPNLTKLGDAYQSVEYGVAAVTLNAGANGVIAVGGSAVSSDIPDDGNPAVVQGRTLIQSTGAGAIAFALRAVIRSNEEDGDATNETAGQAGGFLTVKRVDAAATQADTTPITTYNQAGVLQDCVDDDVTTGGASNQFVVGTPTGASIVTPSGTVTNLSLVNIPGGTLRTDTAGPTGTSTNLLPAALPQCTIAAGGANEIYEVNWTANFVDIPTSTAPGPKE